MNGLSTADFLWNIQCNVILQLAEKGPCVIVGRNADYILKDRKDTLNVFIHADMDFRAEPCSAALRRVRKEPSEPAQREG